jgi:hypothetical protein
MKLKDVLPYEFMGSEYEKDKARTYAEIEVVKQYDSRDVIWAGKHKNVTYWFELENGYAVGMNESPIRGLSFPILKIKSKTIKI